MDYDTIKGEVKSEYEVLHSLFICNVKGIETFDEGVEFVNQVSKKYSDATHNCYAIVMKNGEQKFSDDGEPQGTAGVPICQTIKNNGLTNVVAVVTRYFGGIKLGAGGLVSAYTKATADAIKTSKVVTKKESIVGELIIDYSRYQSFNSFMYNVTSKILFLDFSNNVKIKFAIPTELLDRVTNAVAEISAGTLGIDWGVNTTYIDY